MYQNEEFQEIGTVNAGNLVMKDLDANYIFNYSNGKKYLNQHKNVGYVVVDVIDYKFDVLKLPPMQTKREAALLEAKIKEIEQEGKELVVGKQLYFFFSMTQEGKKIITLPGLNPGKAEDAYFYHAFNPLGIDLIYHTHSANVGLNKLDKNETALRQGLDALLHEAQNLYDKDLELAEEAMIEMEQMFSNQIPGNSTPLIH